ncbi:MAG: hypothetical protein HY647_04955 [Acidobacteria bacterium]|nr:hypothetical protein [Acidobacteriota bacterium]
MRGGQYALGFGVLLLVLCTALGHDLLAQRRQVPPSLPPASSDTPLPPSSSPLGTSIPRKMIKESYEQMRKDVEQLYQLASELREETAKANEDVLSIPVVKKAEEIEKLAKKIQGRMKNL